MKIYRISVMIEAKNAEEAEREFYELICGTQSIDLDIQGVYADKEG